MTYRSYRKSKPQRRSIIVKYAGPCACCGTTIKAGEMADYFPVGYLGATAAQLRHYDPWGNGSPKCAGHIADHLKSEQAAVNDYAGDGLDARYEDDCAEICGR